MSRTANALSWALLALVVIAALVVATSDDGGTPSTEADRVRAIASGVRCPTCRGLSAAESDAKAAQAVRAEIAERVRGGESDASIRAFLASRYGEEILLKPRGDGLVGLVWVVPVVAVVMAIAGLGAAFVRWRRRVGVGVAVGEDDRALVEHALESALR